jgi:aspartate/methionine/tyrosine aminotransferase
MDPDQLLVHNGAEEARSIGCVVDPWCAREVDDWALDTAELRRLARKDTKVIVLNTPHNPTGWHMPAALDALEGSIGSRQEVVSPPARR